MRTILSSSIRPRIGQTQSVLTHGLGAPVRGTNIAIAKRKLTFCDAFTILLCPVFAAAFAIDLTRKDKRRQELYQKIAQVQGEIDALREKELQTWQSLQLRSVQAGIRSQRRSYSTTIGAGVRRVHAERGSDDNSNDDDESFEDKTRDIDPMALRLVEKYENFIATKVGLELLLFVSTGREPTARLGFEGLAEPIVIPKSVNDLLMYLQRVNRALAAQRPQLPDAIADLNLDSQKRKDLDAQVSHFSWQCRIGNISVPELVYRYTNLVMYSDCGLSIHTYQNLVSTFSTLNQDALTFIAMTPYFKTQQVLGDRVVANIIRQYGDVKDPGRLDRFLRKLVLPERGFRIETEWEMVVVNGVSVPTPINRRPRILDLLIRVALQSNQPHRARAWTTLLIQEGVLTRRLASVFLNFVTYCAAHVDWSHGQVWLLRTITFAAYFANKSPWMLHRLIFRILDLCVACDKMETFDVVLDAAITAGLDAPPLDDTRPDFFTDRARDIRDEWALRLKEARAEIRDSSQSIDAAIIFQTEIAKIYTAMGDFVGVIDIASLRTLSTGKQASSTSHDLQRDMDESPDPHGLNPWNEPSHVGLPDDVLASLSGKRTTRGAEESSEELNTTGTNMINTNQQQSELQSQYLKMQEEHKRLTDQYQQQLETNNTMRKLIDNEFPSNANTGSDYDLQEMTRKLFQFQESNLQYQARHSQLQREVEEANMQNADLQAKLEASMEKESALTNLIDKLRAQFIQSRKTKSLEAVFLEKENFNLNFEMKDLRQKTSTAVSDKEKIERELHTSRSNYEKLEAKAVKEMDQLHQKTKKLQGQLEAANTQYGKLSEASKAREEHLNKVIEIYEARQKELRAELSRSKSSNAAPSAGTAEGSSKKLQ